MLNVCFIGLGSIGTRHLKNLVGLSEQRNMELNIDALRSDIGKTLDYRIKKEIRCIYHNYKDIPDNYDVIFITNPTSLHYKTLLEVKNKAKNFFIEKPVFHTSNINLHPLSFQRNQAVYVACPMRYENTIQYIKQNIDLSDVFCARAICSSYLPDWRPGIDYRKSYSAHKEMGGGVSIDLIHEWDYLCYLLGVPKQVYSLIQKKSDLEIDSDDIAVYIGKNENCIFEIHLDYFGREEIRQLQLFKKDTTISVDLLKGTIRDSKQQKEIKLYEQRNEYQVRELSYFLDMIEGKVKNTNDMMNALKILRIAEREKR